VPPAFKQDEPIIVTRHGKIVGFFLPAAGETLPLEIKKELFATATKIQRVTAAELLSACFPVAGPR
jgi:hypothetical protein